MVVDTRRTVVIDEAPLGVADVVAIAAGATVSLGPAAVERIGASRAVVDGLVAGDELIYGLNTGLGHARDERVPLEILEAMQSVVVRAHAGGIGPALRTPIVRAAMAVRVAGIARGGSGASPAIAETYVAMLNAGVHPIVPSAGSVGASDLAHMAAIALVAMGEGTAEVGGETLPGAEALARAGIPPVRLAPKDGLTIISANGVAVGHAALVVERAGRVADAADLVAALSLEAVEGNLSIVDPAVAAAKPVPEQAVVAARMRAFLEGSALCTAGAARSVQDPLSFRVVPQVHGAYRAVVGAAERATDQELAAMDDNPLVVVDERRMVSNGNFHPMLLALAVDAIRPALAHVCQVADRRTSHLWNRVVADPEAFTPGGSDRLMRYGSPLLHYAGAARAAELRALAGPATLGIAPLDLGVEDHATLAPQAAARTEEALDMAEDVLAIELLTATGAAGWRDASRERMGPRTRHVLDLVAARLAALGAGASSPAVHDAAKDLLREAVGEGAAT